MISTRSLAPTFIAAACATGFMCSPSSESPSSESGTNRSSRMVQVSTSAPVSDVRPVVTPQPVQTQVRVAPRPLPLPDLPARPDVGVASSKPTSSSNPRKAAWLGETFRCRAISTTRFRKCRFEETGDGIRIRFKKADIACDEVVFDENGDPKTLNKCRSNWLRIPSKNPLRTDSARKVWSGSKKGWRWKSDRQPYCCPGIWLEAPPSLRH